jgi:hypothetical protein
VSDPNRLVVRRHRPWRPLLVIGALVAAALAIGIGAFEGGRMSANYSTVKSALERRALQSQLDAANAQVAALETKIAELEVARRVDREASAQIEKSLGDLETRLGEQAQELAFYRSIVSPKNGAPGLRIVRVQVLPGTRPLNYRLRIVLIQAQRPTSTVAGTIGVSLDGTRSGRAVSLPLSELGKSAELAFSLRSFQELETELDLPADLHPMRLQVEVRPKGAEAPLRQSVAWKIDTPLTAAR